ncbi:hypothetical protein HAX54_050310, partial [Datura stramonium]|nr:hypothetical protein [Datura stramonium]
TGTMLLLVKMIMPLARADDFALSVSSGDLKQGAGCITWLLRRAQCCKLLSQQRHRTNLESIEENSEVGR